MAKKLETQTNFNAGELTPRMFGRVDVDKYHIGVETATNFFATIHGPMHRRAGTQFIAETKASANASRLIRFQFSSTDAFMLEFGNLYIRFFKDSGVVGGGPFEVVTTYTTAELDDIQYEQDGDDIYLVHPDHAPAKLTRNGDEDWTLADLDPSPPPTFEKGEFPATTVTPGATTGVGITFTAGAAAFVKADVGRQIQNQVGTGRASITAYTSTTVVTCAIVEDFPSTSAIASGDWKLDLSPLADLTPDGSTVGAIVNVTSDEAGGVTALDTFRTGDVGKYIIIHGGVLQIITRNSGSDVDCEVLKSLNEITETSVWKLETETWDSTRGFPSTVAIYQERLIFGGTVAQPTVVQMSEQAIFNGFGIGPDDEDAIQVTLGGNQVNKISWITAARDLVVGTAGSEITISSGSTGTAITPSAKRQDNRTFFGSNSHKPIAVGNEVLFIQKSKRKVRAFRFDFNIDNYASEDLHQLSEHITSGLIKEIAYAQEPDSQIYAVTEDGELLVGAYRRDQNILGWTRYTTDGSFESVQVITEGSVDQVWVIVKRTIDGSTKRYVELFEDGDGTDRVDGYSDSFLVHSVPNVVTAITQADPAVVTSTGHTLTNGDDIKIVDVLGMTEVNGVSFLVANTTANTFEITDLDGVDIDSTAFTAYTSGGEAHELVTTISGLTHLEGETVEIKADGAPLAPDQVVSSGSITLPRKSYEVVVGLNYTSTIKTLKKEYDIGMGSMQGQQTRYPRVVIRVYNSAEPLLNGEFTPARSGSDLMDKAVPLFSGDLEYGPLPWDNTGQLTFTISTPLPLQLQGLFGTIEGGIK